MKKLVFCLFLGGFILAGCRKETKITLNEEGNIEILFSAQSLSSSLLKSTATSDEQTVNEIILFGVDGSDNIVQNAITGGGTYFKTLSGLELIDALELSTKLTIARKVASLYAIANPSSAHKSATPANVTNLLALTESFTTAPESPFLMSGSGEVNHGLKTVIIELIRAVAKIELKSVTGSGFEITSVTVLNTPRIGFVFEQTAFGIPSTPNRGSYVAVSSSAPILYVAESPGSSSPQTSFSVTGTYEGKEATYEVFLKKGGVELDIVRNTHYVVNISPVTETQCTITINIVDWKDEEADIVEIPYEEFQ